MLHAVYIGGVKSFRYEKALLREAEVKGYYLAQFDNLSLGRNLTHAWTAFPKADWEILEGEEST